MQQQLKTLKQSRLGFTVQTLHGVALQIANRYPEQSGLDLNARTLIAPNHGHRLIKTAVEKWQQQHPNDYRVLVESGDFDGETTETLRRQTSLSGDILPALTRAVVSEAKSSGLSPDDIRELSRIPPGSPILATGAGLFAAYQQLVAAQNWLDYDDMILAALRVLDDPSCCRQWQQQFFGVFEDEAQDSSPLQERLITRLARDPAHHQSRLVRVGDPNQAINSTFTPADPIYFNQFCQQCAAQGQFATMDQAGRSNAAVINAANELIAWVNQDWQRRYGQGVDTMPPPFRLQNIRPVDAGDPQPNPPPTDRGVEIHFPADIFQEAQQIRPGCCRYWRRIRVIALPYWCEKIAKQPSSPISSDI